MSGPEFNPADDQQPTKEEWELYQERKSHHETMKERDAAEDAMSQAYFLITGRSPEWSSSFGYQQALDDIKDSQELLRKSIPTIDKALVHMGCASHDQKLATFLNEELRMNPDRVNKALSLLREHIPQTVWDIGVPDLLCRWMS